MDLLRDLFLKRSETRYNVSKDESFKVIAICVPAGWNVAGIFSSGLVRCLWISIMITGFLFLESHNNIIILLSVSCLWDEKPIPYWPWRCLWPHETLPETGIISFRRFGFLFDRRIVYRSLRSLLLFKCLLSLWRRDQRLNPYWATFHLLHTCRSGSVKDSFSWDLKDFIPGAVSRSKVCSQLFGDRRAICYTCFSLCLSFLWIFILKTKRPLIGESLKGTGNAVRLRSWIHRAFGFTFYMRIPCLLSFETS